MITIVSTCDLIEKIIKEGSNVPRKGHTQKRDVLADPKYNNKIVTKLVNSIMLDGKKGVAQKIVYGAFEKMETKTGKPALEVFEEAMNNVMPVLEVKARRIGGATYQVPIEVRPDRRQALGLRWLTMFSRTRTEKTMEERLANEIMDAAGNTGSAVKRKEEMHRMAEANKAFAHYRF
jgi:small subunit ribosomal protein S7